VFENVEGFLTADKGNRVFDLLEPLMKAGYRIHLRKVNAANYGVPQHRKRVIAMGGLGFDIAFPEPTHRAFGAPGASRTLNHLPPCPTLADALNGLPAPTENPPGMVSGHFLGHISNQDLNRIHVLKPGQSMRDLPVELWHNSYKRRAFRRVMDGTPTERRGGAPFGLRRLRSDEPSKAITSGAISEFVHPTENRFLTLREGARIQTFSDSFTFVGTVSEISLLIGNAVPPRFAELIARSLRKSLSQTSFLVHKEGALLSFVPTDSTGRSPALEKVCKRIVDTFRMGHTKSMEQLQSWF
jgi:DNA (cytosine-5)-methyltransferase 1